jgi:hypothetical protein
MSRYPHEKPIGSLTPPEHEHSAAIDEAAAWLSTTPRERIPGPVVPLLRRRFGLSIAEACAAIREAHLIKARAT